MSMKVFRMQSSPGRPLKHFQTPIVRTTAQSIGSTCCADAFSLIRCRYAETGNTNSPVDSSCKLTWREAEMNKAFWRLTPGLGIFPEMACAGMYYSSAEIPCVDLRIRNAAVQQIAVRRELPRKQYFKMQNPRRCANLQQATVEFEG